VRCGADGCQTPGVKWPSVTRPADSTSAPPILSAPRSCVCGHPVYDDQEPQCPLCACQEHKPRLLTADDHSAPATVSPGTGEAWSGPQPELSGAVSVLTAFTTAGRWPGTLQQQAAAPEAVSADAPRRRHPATRFLRCPAVGRPGRTQPRAGVTVNPVAPGHPARLWPPSPQLAGHVNIRCTLPPSPQRPPRVSA
jgi:hypothetical protein